MFSTSDVTFRKGMRVIWSWLLMNWCRIFFLRTRRAAWFAILIWWRRLVGSVCVVNIASVNVTSFSSSSFIFSSMYCSTHLVRLWRSF